MKISDWISLVSSIGAMSAALVALFTLIELFRQRKSSYKPDLCVIQDSFYLKGFELKDKEVCLALDWVTQGQDNDQVQGEILSRPSIRLVNIGFGAAKKIKATWNFKFEKLLTEINQMAQRNYEVFFIEKDEQFLTLKSKGADLYGVSTQACNWEFEYLLPSSSDSHGHELYLPPSYKLLVSVYLSLCAKEDRTFENIQVPSLELEIKYTDIGKGKHKSRHKLACEILQIKKYAKDKTEKISPEFGVRFIETS